MAESGIKNSTTEYRSLEPVPRATSGKSAVCLAFVADARDSARPAHLARHLDWVCLYCTNPDELVTNIIVSKGYGLLTTSYSSSMVCSGDTSRHAQPITHAAHRAAPLRRE
ncbi:hypothetical protein ABZX51_006911 [Aspergillus tubingensis]